MLSVCLQSDHNNRLMIYPDQSGFSESGLLASSDHGWRVIFHGKISCLDKKQWKALVTLFTYYFSASEGHAALISLRPPQNISNCSFITLIWNKNIFFKNLRSCQILFLRYIWVSRMLTSTFLLFSCSVIYSEQQFLGEGFYFLK